MNSTQTVIILVGVFVFSIAGALAGVYLAPEVLGLKEHVTAPSATPETVAEKPSQPYDMLVEGNKLARLNRETGDLLLIDDKGISFFEQAAMTHEKLVDFTFTQDEHELKERAGDFPFSKGDMWDNVSYKLIGDQLHFRYEYGPYIKSVDEAISKSDCLINLQFRDSNEFSVLKIAIPLNQRTRIQGNDGEVVFSEYSGTLECSEEEYRLIAGVGVGWAFDDSLAKVIENAIDEAKEIVDRQRAALQAFLDDGSQSGFILGNVYYTPGARGGLKMTSARYWQEMVDNWTALRTISAQQSATETEKTEANDSEPTEKSESSETATPESNSE